MSVSLGFYIFISVFLYLKTDITLLFLHCFRMEKEKGKRSKDLSSKPASASVKFSKQAPHPPSLPLVDVRELPFPEQAPRRQIFSVRPSTYIRFVEKTVEELAELIECDMDPEVCLCSYFTILLVSLLY